jgi:hypothetical protein
MQDERSQAVADGHRPSPGGAAPSFTQSEFWPPVKTSEGVAEMRQRQRGLNQRQRTMLLLVDGRRSVMQVKQIAVQAGAPDTCFDELIELGLIELPEPVRLQPVPQPQPAVPEPVPQPMLAHRDEAVESAHPREIDSIVVAADAFDDERSSLNESMPPTTQSPPTESGLVDSMMSSLFPLFESAFGGLGRTSDLPRDDALEEARRILMREVRAKAPVAGALTLMKLRRAQTREELMALFDEVDSHIGTLMRHLSAQQTLLHVRGLLERPM